MHIKLIKVRTVETYGKDLQNTDKKNHLERSSSECSNSCNK